eukprot:TRINITY_DN6399_c0_g1_i7.p1 TRINITY_DN6399_c0_g1~~TRINITY_DN6399_c0_g1_i7.p1  ORF type:complete len:489 (+),score=49.40 TRINITY_DN6399_c0_g1_i7:59-1468(+)
MVFGYLCQPIFLRSLLFSLPSGLISAIWVNYKNTGALHYLEVHGTVFSSLSMLISLFIAFRASQAYARYCNGAHAIHRFRAHFIDVASNLFAISRCSSASPEDVIDFRHIIVRLFSMLETFCLVELSAENHVDGSEVPFCFPILDTSFFDEETMTAIKESEYPVDLLVQWVQSVIVDAMGSHVLSAPPPICTRVFQELQSGLAWYQQAQQITEIPIPFPYTLATRSVIAIFWFLMPLSSSNWSEAPVVAGLLAFTQVFAVIALNGVADEMENPFGTDANDLDLEDGHAEFNHKLWLMLTPSFQMTPKRASHVKADAEGFDREILKKQATLGGVFGSDPIQKRQTLFKYTGNAKEPSIGLCAKPLSDGDSLGPPVDVDVASSDAIVIEGIGNGSLISGNSKPSTQVPEGATSERRPSHFVPLPPSHDGDEQLGAGSYSNENTISSVRAVNTAPNRGGLFDQNNQADCCSV